MSEIPFICFLSFFILPTGSGEEHIVLPLSVRTFVRHSVCPSIVPCSSILVSATAPTIFDAGIRNLHHSSDKEGGGILIQVIIAEECAFE